MSQHGASRERRGAARTERTACATHLVGPSLLAGVPLLGVGDGVRVVRGEVVGDAALAVGELGRQVAHEGPRQSRVGTEAGELVLRARKTTTSISARYDEAVAARSRGDERDAATHRSLLCRVLAEPHEVELVGPQVGVGQDVVRLDGRDALLGRVPQLGQGHVGGRKRGGDGGGAPGTVLRVERDVSLFRGAAGGRGRYWAMTRRREAGETLSAVLDEPRSEKGRERERGRTR